MNKKELIEYYCERLSALPPSAGRVEDYRRIYHECMNKALACGFSERAFADMWYNARLWYEATVCRCA